MWNILEYVESLKYVDEIPRRFALPRPWKWGLAGGKDLHLAAETLKAAIPEPITPF